MGRMGIVLASPLVYQQKSRKMGTLLLLILSALLCFVVFYKVIDWFEKI